MNSVGTGGAEFSTLSFYGWLLKNGHEVRLVCLKKTTPAYDVTQFGFGEVHFLEGGSFWQKLRTFNQLIKKFRPGIVHSVLFAANILGRFSRIWHRNFVHLESLVNETYSEHRLSDPQVTRLKLTAYRLFDFVTQWAGVDHFHVNGASVAQHYQQKLFITSRRMTLIPRGRMENSLSGNAAHRAKLRREFQTGDRILLINVARHEYQKGQDVLLGAIGQLKDEQHRIQLLLVGREGKLTPLLKEKIRTFGLEKSVLLLGHRDDVPALIAAADVFVFPSRFEGLPGALIEAEAAGLPIIASDIPNNREVAEADKNALFFPVDDSLQLAEVIAELLNNAGLRQQFGAESCRIFQSRYSMEKVHQQMLALLQQLAALA